MWNFECIRNMRGGWEGGVVFFCVVLGDRIVIIWLVVGFIFK